MKIIEQILQENSLNTEQSILMGQWEFDKKNIPAALKAVAIIFPHFSLHDESHSASILNNIVKILGEKVIRNLSCTDLWLLLESAYCHDLGMVVTVNRFEQALESDAFLKHFLKINADNNHPCYDYSNTFLVKEGKLYFKEDVFDTKQLDAIRFLLADYFRTKHAENSKKTITNPLSEAGIESPRSIIPSRLFSILSDICNAHTQSFDEVMSLPKNEDGIGLDECHPRFIACMLRIGDLLDIDNSRFSDTLIKTVKELPSDSQAHFEKHEAISHLSINTKSIEIEAVCKTPKVAQVIQDWFDWISDEFKTQTLKWNSIVPDGVDCYLPTLNYLRIKIDGYETVNDSKKPKFTIDTTKALELLQGKNFYNDVFDSIREIIQNAVDSTLLKMYLDAKKENKKFDKIGEEFLKYAEKYPINVAIAKNEGKYCLEVSDRGVGLKRDQLTYLINTGSSSKNVEKKLIIDEMPEWMRPSGVFGIGFQSIFLLTNKVEVLTKDCFKEEKMWIELYSPNSPMKGDVYLKKIESPLDTGFTIKFVLNDNLIKDTVKDPFNAYQRDYRMSMVENKIRDYAAKSVIPIVIKHQDQNGIFSETIQRQQFNFYDQKTGIELSFNSKSFEYSYLGGSSYFYRNARVNGNGSEIMFLSPEVNIHFGNAKDILTLDRGAFKDGKLIKERVIDAIINFMNSDDYQSLINSLGEMTQMAAYRFSLFVEYYERKSDILNKDILSDINSFTIDLSGTTFNINQIVSSPVIKIRTTSNQVLAINNKDGVLMLEANLIPVFSPSFIVETVKLIFKMVSDTHKHCYCTERIVNFVFAGAEYHFTNDDEIPEIKLTMKDIKADIERSSSRCYVNYLPGYEDIRIVSEQVDSSIIDSLMVSPIPNRKIEKIISPFIQIKGKLFDCRNDEMYQYVSEMTGSDIAAVKNAYDRFVESAVNTGIKISEIG